MSFRRLGGLLQALGQEAMFFCFSDDNGYELSRVILFRS